MHRSIIQANDEIVRMSDGELYAKSGHDTVETSGRVNELSRRKLYAARRPLIGINTEYNPCELSVRSLARRGIPNELSRARHTELHTERCCLYSADGAIAMTEMTWQKSCLM